MTQSPLVALIDSGDPVGTTRVSQSVLIVLFSEESALSAAGTSTAAFVGSTTAAAALSAAGSGTAAFGAPTPAALSAAGSSAVSLVSSFSTDYSYVELYLLITPAAALSAREGYYLYYDEDGFLELGRFNGDGTTTVLDSDTITLLAADDRLLLRKIGTTLTGWVRRGGVWFLEITASDATYNGPLFVGMGMNQTTSGDDFVIEEFGGGSISVSEGAMLLLDEDDPGAIILR